MIGSNVFNLAALLGLAAVVAGWIGFHRRVVVLAGVPAVWIAAVCLLTVASAVGPAAGLALTAVVLVPYVTVLGMRRARMERLRLPARWVRWLVAAVHEEETELAEAIRPRRGTWRDAVAAAAALIAVIGASTVMEVAATALGRRYAVADIVVGGLVLAVVTSLPNAVSAVYPARRGRGAAVLSIALNSNAINVVAGLRAADWPVDADRRGQLPGHRPRGRARRPGPDLRHPHPVCVPGRRHGRRDGRYRRRGGPPAPAPLTAARIS